MNPDDPAAEHLQHTETNETTPWDAADYLTTEQDVDAYLDAAKAEDNPRLLVAALGDVAQTTETATDAG